MDTTKHTHRFIARFKMEAETPLFVGSGESSLMVDALVQKDINGFPMIPGTSLAGVLRHAIGKEAEVLFGASHAEKNGVASKLKVSSAYMLIENEKISEGILDTVSSELADRFDNLPKRQHVRINEKGVAEKHGLFDNEVVYKGTQFVFELEVRGTKEDEAHWKEVLKLVQLPTFRIGSGTRNGYGLLRVIASCVRTFDLTQEVDFNAYLNFDPSFNSNLALEKIEISTIENRDFTKYSLHLTPDSFFIFSAGFGDDGADYKPVEENVINYNKGKMEFIKQTLIPASSIKGAISHRVSFHFSKETKAYAGNTGINVPNVGVKNEAVATLFGKAGKDVKEPSAGNVYLNDFYFSNEQIGDKIFNHVAIDRFTGGAMQGALFSEKVTNLLDKNFSFEIYVNTEALENEHIKAAFENTLTDICKGLLPLGGMTTKGHGIFTGQVIKDEQLLFNYNSNEN